MNIEKSSLGFFMKKNEESLLKDFMKEDNVDCKEDRKVFNIQIVVEREERLSQKLLNFESLKGTRQ